MADGVGEGEGCCINGKTMICLLLVAAPAVTVLSLSLVTRSPKIDVEDFFIPALNNPGDESNGSSVNTFIFINLSFRNVMPLNGFRCEALNLTLFYGGNRSFPVASYAASGFYGGPLMVASDVVVVGTRGLPWGDAFDRVSRGLTVDFAVELAATVRLRRCGAYLKRKAVVVAADVSLDGSTGEQVDNKPIAMH